MPELSEIWSLVVLKVTSYLQITPSGITPEVWICNGVTVSELELGYKSATMDDEFCSIIPLCIMILPS